MDAMTGSTASADDADFDAFRAAGGLRMVSRAHGLLRRLGFWSGRWLAAIVEARLRPRTAAGIWLLKVGSTLERSHSLPSV